MTELKLALIRRAAALVVECERLENCLANGETVDVDLLARLSSHTRRIAETIGIDRVKRDTTPTISELVADHNAANTAKTVAARAALAAKRAEAAERAKPIEEPAP